MGGGASPEALGVGDERIPNPVASPGIGTLREGGSRADEAVASSVAAAAAGWASHSSATKYVK